MFASAAFWLTVRWSPSGLFRRRLRARRWWRRSPPRKRSSRRGSGGGRRRRGRKGTYREEEEGGTGGGGQEGGGGVAVSCRRWRYRPTKNGVGGRRFGAEDEEWEEEEWEEGWGPEEDVEGPEDDWDAHHGMESDVDVEEEEEVWKSWWHWGWWRGAWSCGEWWTWRGGEVVEVWLGRAWGQATGGGTLRRSLLGNRAVYKCRWRAGQLTSEGGVETAAPRFPMDFQSISYQVLWALRS